MLMLLLPLSCFYPTVYENGSWENGLSYECRSLLFKALHNLIERSLLAKGFARFGKWFTQPTVNNYPSSNSPPSGAASSPSSSSSSSAATSSNSSSPNKRSQLQAAQLSFAFDFFVHGDSTVCVSVDVRQHPRIFRIGSKNLLAVSQPGSSPARVILSPYGLSGTLTGHTVKDSDPSVQKLLSEWRRFYPLQNVSSKNEQPSNQSSNSRSGSNSAPSQQNGNNQGEPDLERRDNCPSALEINVAGVRIMYPSAYVFFTPDEVSPATPPPTTAAAISNASNCNSKALDNTTQSKQNNATDFLLTPPNSPYSDTQSKLKTPTMSPHQPIKPQTTFLIRSAAGQDIVTASEGANSSEDANDPFNWEGYSGPTCKADCLCFRCKSGRKNGLTNVKAGSVPNKKSEKERLPKRPCLPFHKRIQQHSSPLVDTIVGSPEAQVNEKATGDVLNDIQPTNTPSQYKSPAADGLPSLQSSVTTPGIDSPASVQTLANNERPPSNKLTTSTASPFYSVKDSSNHVNSPLLSPMLKEKGLQEQSPYHKAVASDKPSQLDESSVSWPASTIEVNNSSTSENVEQNKSIVPEDVFDGKLGRSALLYDFSSVSIDSSDWLDMPQPKRRRKIPITDGDSQSNSDSVQSKSKDPYEFFDGDDKQPSSEDKGAVVLPSLPPTTSNTWSCIGLMKEHKLLTDTVSSPQTPQFTRQEDLNPSMNDLDQMFETSSGEDSNDGNSNGKSQRNWQSVCPNAIELARMFPTPPSLEQHTAPSPSTLALEAAFLDEANAAPCSPAFLERIRDSTDVYKPPVVCKMIAPTKYAPLDLTSTTITQLQLKRPSNCKYEPSTAIDNRRQIPFNAPLKRTSITSLPPTQAVTPATSSTPSSSSSSSSSSQPSIISNSTPNPSNSNMYLQIQSRRPPIPNSAPSPVHSMPNSYPLAPQGEMSFVTGHANSKMNPRPITHGMFDDSTGAADDQLKATISPPESNALLLNLALSDSLLNLHKDHNFESCTLCVCNTNIKGADSRLYLSESLVAGDNEPQYKCVCGFSAVVNRRMSQYSGLFYEDELEVIGIPYEPRESVQGDKSVLSLFGNLEPGAISEATSLLLEILRSQCSYTIPSASIFSKCQFSGFLSLSAYSSTSSSSPPSSSSSTASTSNLLAIESSVAGSNKQIERFESIVKSDSCAISALILLAGKEALDSFPKIPPEQLKAIRNLILHPWQFSHAPFPSNNHETVRFLRKLQPLLQESVQKKPTKMWEVCYSVSGPLTWRQFHRLAGRGAEDQCEPQPIPSLLVGHNREWVGVAPYALKMWDQLYLEPYSTTRDVAYFVLSPGSQFLVPRVKTFFRELSNTYELLRLGKHVPGTQSVRDGIFRISKSQAAKVSEEPTDEWFNRIPDASLAAKLKIYSQFCTGYLIPFIKEAMKNLENLYKQQPSQKSSTHSSTIKTSIPSPGAADAFSSEVKNDEQTGETSQQPTSTSSASDDLEDESNKQPAFVIYIVEPFTFNSLDTETYRLACSGLLRCFAQIYKAIPDLQKHLNLQIVSLDSILNHSTDVHGSTRKEQLRSLSFSVFGQCRKTIHPLPLCKSLTGFGPAASLDYFIKKTRECGSANMHSNTFFCPPFILAPLKDKQTELGEMFGERREKSQVLYCSYCLTEDQRWLVASCANDKGDILETTVINVDVPNRTKRQGATVRKFGLNKLMEFLVHIMSESSLEPWRLVIGRLGRIGHGELREWASFLSKKALLKATTRLKDKCEQCKSLSYFELPSILSACLVSLEPDTSLRVFPDQFTSEDRFSSNTCVLSTPEDASSTHLLIFPTSATIQPPSSHSNPNDPAMGDDDPLGFADLTDVPDGEDDGMNDLFNWNDDLSSPGMQGSEQQGLSGHPDSPAARQGAFDTCGVKVNTVTSTKRKSSHFITSFVLLLSLFAFPQGSAGFNDLSDEPLQLWLQPLALGYYVSTAQVGQLPRWFWSSCPHMRDVNPVFLKVRQH